MKRTVYLILCLFSMACSKGGDENSPPKSTPPDPDEKPESQNKPPSIPGLVFPDNDQLCLESDLNFNWSDAVDPEGSILSYQLQISSNRAFTEIVEDHIVDSNDLNLILEKGHDYYWHVLAIDSKGAKGEYSPAWAFYVKGEASSNHIPSFPQLTAPTLGTSIASATVKLQWEGSDVDGDSLTYDVYFGTEEIPELYQSNLQNSFLELDVEPNKVYYWQVYVSDGNAKSVGDVWSFSTDK